MPSMVPLEATLRNKDIPNATILVSKEINIIQLHLTFKFQPPYMTPFSNFS